MDMSLVYMGGYNEGVVFLRKPLGKLIAHTGGFRWGYIPRLEGLTHLVGDGIPLLYPAGDNLIYPSVVILPTIV